jgi:hypothetical protein
MTIVRCVAGLAAVVSAMLVQATLVGPLTYPVPVSLPLLVVVGVAVLSGPSTGIALGFGAGLLADLTSHHPIGLLAVTWLGAGIVAGIVGGLVIDPGQANHPVARSTRTARARSRKRSDTGFGSAPEGMSRWRAQGLLTGLVGVAATGFAMLALDVIGALNISSADQSGPGALLLLIPAGLIDAMLAVPLLALIRFMLASPALRPAVSIRLSPDAMSAARPAIR